MRAKITQWSHSWSYSITNNSRLKSRKMTWYQRSLIHPQAAHLKTLEKIAKMESHHTWIKVSKFPTRAIRPQWGKKSHTSRVRFPKNQSSHQKITEKDKPSCKNSFSREPKCPSYYLPTPRSEKSLKPTETKLILIDTVNSSQQIVGLPFLLYVCNTMQVDPIWTRAGCWIRVDFNSRSRNQH